MCGRYTLRLSREQIAEAFALLDAPELFPRYNIDPLPENCSREYERIHPAD
jgi:putative SOS response-associated peptidase YedK